VNNAATKNTHVTKLHSVQSIPQKLNLLSHGARKRPPPFNKIVLHVEGQRFESSTAHHN